MQGSMSVLNPVRRIEKSFADFAQRPLGLTGNAFWDRVKDHLEHLKLPPTVLRSYPHELSGGMRQRVTIGLATVCHPEFIIADEPTTALDVVVQKDVLALLRNIQQEIKSSVVFVTHDMAVHANITDRVGIIYAGRLVEERAPAICSEAPSTPIRHIWWPVCRALATRASVRRSKDGRQTLPTRQLDAASIRVARWPSTSAAAKCRRLRRWVRNTVPRAGVPMRCVRFLMPKCGRRGGELMTHLLEVDHVNRRFVSGGILGRTITDAVVDANFVLEKEKPEIFTIIGESGSGKTTLARMILGLDTPSQGSIRFEGYSRFRPACGARIAPPSWPRCSPCSRTRSRHSPAQAC